MSRLQLLILSVIHGTESKVKSIVMDKDVNFMNNIQEAFPNEKILLCKFHILESFHAHVKELSVSYDEKEIIMSLLKKLLHAKSDVILD